MPAIASQLLMAGITSARDPMAPTDAVLHVKAPHRGAAIFPDRRCTCPGALLEHQGPAGFESFRMSVAGAADARAKVNQLADHGVDLIKLLCVPEMTLEEATRRGRAGARSGVEGRRARADQTQEVPQVPGGGRRRFPASLAQADFSRRHRRVDQESHAPHAAAHLDADSRRAARLERMSTNTGDPRRSGMASRSAGRDIEDVSTSMAAFRRTLPSRGRRSIAGC